MKKKVLISILTALLLLSSPSIVYADDVTIDEKIDYLEDNGIPDDLLTDEHLVNRMYERLYGLNFTYGGCETVTLSETNTSGADVLGIIPEDDLTLRIFEITNEDYDEDAETFFVKNVLVFVGYSWAEGAPLVRNEDAITVNWDPDVFTFEEDSFYAYDDKYVHYPIEDKYFWYLSHEYTRPEILSQGGLGYVANLSDPLPIGYDIQIRKGWADFSLLPTDPLYHTDGESVTSVNVNYVHDYEPFPTTITFTIGNTYSVTVDTSSWFGYDSAAVALNYSYSYIID